MQDINFKPIFDYIDGKVDELKADLKVELATKKDIEGLENHIDLLAKQTKEAGEKATVADAKSNKVEHWVLQAAEKINLPYKA